jgi:signal transduction histidine kinase
MAPYAGHHDAAASLLRHELKTPLTTISVRAQLIARWTARSPTLAEDERARTLAGLAAIDAAVQQLLAAIDAIGADETEGTDNRR